MLEEERIQELKEEQRTIKDQLVATLSDQRMDDYTSLKIRSDQIPHQIKFLEIQLQKNKIKDLEEQERQKLIEIETAKEESKNFDLFEMPKVATLKAEASRINQKGLAMVVMPQLLQDSLGHICRRLADERKKLFEMEKEL
jgi:hypothetical protein